VLSVCTIASDAEERLGSDWRIWSKKWDGVMFLYMVVSPMCYSKSVLKARVLQDNFDVKIININDSR